MPTPFTHLAYAQRLAVDLSLPASTRDFLAAHLPAYLLGSIAADAQTIASMNREDTHFYSYEREITEHPYRVMLARYPTLPEVTSADAQAFMAGYAAHLGMDEIWTLHMTRPHFAQRDWGTREQRFVALHLLLVSMDERDERLLRDETTRLLEDAAPHGWCPFIPDEVLREWQALIARQMPPAGKSETLEVICPRVRIPVSEFRAMLDDDALMQRELWAHITPALLADVEAMMMDAARAQLLDALLLTGA